MGFFTRNGGAVAATPASPVIVPRSIFNGGTTDIISAQYPNPLSGYVGSLPMSFSIALAPAAWFGVASRAILTYGTFFTSNSASIWFQDNNLYFGVQSPTGWRNRFITAAQAGNPVGGSRHVFRAVIEDVFPNVLSLYWNGQLITAAGAGESAPGIDCRVTTHPATATHGTSSAFTGANVLSRAIAWDSSLNGSDIVR